LLGATIDDPGTPTHQHPPQPAPILDIVIDQERGAWIGPHVFDPAQLTRID
jgi:hypothetical protein